MSPDVLDLILLLEDSQAQLKRIEYKIDLIHVARQQLIADLKLLLPKPILLQPDGANEVFGRASKAIVSTSITNTKQQFYLDPSIIPSEILLDS